MDPPASEARARPWRPRLRTVLLTVNLLILLLPLGGIAALRLYENHLIRRTEGELIVQGALVRESYRRGYVERAEAGDVTDPGIALPAEWQPPEQPEGDLEPIVPRLDISTERVRPRAEKARRSGVEPDAIAAAVGAELEPILDASGKTTLAGIRLVDAAGIVVASSGDEQGLSLAHREEVGDALAGRPVSLLRSRVSDSPPPPVRSISRGQRYRVFVALPVIEDRRVIGAVVLSRTPMDISKAIYLNRRPLLFGAATLLAVVVLVSVLTSLTISRPVRALIRQAGQAREGERGAMVPLPAPGTLELEQLSEALAGMARSMERRADYIRSFASHVSHEFKTPLTTIHGSVELLRDHLDEMSPEERDGFLENLAQASSRLERLVGRLLEQARADVLRPGDERCVVGTAIDRAVRRHTESGLDVRVEHERDAAEVRIGEQVLVEIVSNLLDNARLHGGEDVRVRVTTRTVGEVVELRVLDDGPGISEANAARVFTPFFTTARDRGGSGLGLSIVRSLLEAHSGTIELDDHASGAGFLIRLRR